MRVRSWVRVLLSSGVVLGLVAFSGLNASGQTEAATIRGAVTDSTGAVVSNAAVRLVDVDRGTRSESQTNGSGFYNFASVVPGRYRMEVEKSGFKLIHLTGITVNVQDNLEENFKLDVGAISESITVEANGVNVNTTDGSVSTVVDRKYIENMPLNGRSFQDLILLTPGVVTNSPQRISNSGVDGEFSVNGQRTGSNYYTVDGVSANVGITPAGPQFAASSGSLPASTALGTTQALVSVDALEEFRVQSSSYSAEYGRNPGGQFSFVTRSGTNNWHGTAFDYFRNDVFDANDWFTNYLGHPQPPLRQNDFGGTLGGPITVPLVYNGRDKLFFFFSYEGLRLLQPQQASTSIVPTLQLRQSAPSALQPLLNAFPVSNCTPSQPSCVSDIGNGFGDFVGTWSNPSQLDTTSIRTDYEVNQRLRLFFRFSNADSNSAVRLGGNFQNPANVNSFGFTTRTYTLGATSVFSAHLSNDFRLNYSTNDGESSSRLSNFGGAQAVNLWQLQGAGAFSDPSVAILLATPDFSFGSFMVQQSARAEQRQWNVVDSLGLSHGPHQIKFGIDFRRSTPFIQPNNPSITYLYASQNSVQTNSVDEGQAVANAPAYPIYSNFSAFAQDEWRISPRLSLSLGLRWEVNPAPGARRGNLPYTVEGNSLSTLSLAPQGTSLWETTWYNFAPRLGAVYVLRNASGWETVVRGGGGVFFDTGQQLGSNGYTGPGFSAMNNFGAFLGVPASFPTPLGQVVPAITNPPVAPFTATVYAFPRHLQLPYTLQWNASIEQALGKSQALTVSYVGAAGRRLLGWNVLRVTPFNPNFGDVFFSRGNLTSDHDALQVQFQRRLGHGLQALASYTWAHTIDFGSYDSSLPYTRGNSEYDVRHNFSTAVSYDLPNTFQNRFARAVLHHWGLDDRFSARTGFPVTLNGNENFDPATGKFFFSGLDVVQGQPLYIYGAQCAAVYTNGLACPGGRAINPNAFSLPSGSNVGGAPRNFARGFGAWQMDLAVRRDFPIYEKLRLQFRAEAFNVFNHPSFGLVNPIFCLPSTPPAPQNGCTFGQANGTLAQALGVLNPLYQMGGPRSMQFALKLIF